MNFEKLKNDILKKLSHELPCNLYYHNVEHSIKVLEAAERIAAFENISEKDLILLKTAAILHDCGFLRQYTKNEPAGCKIASEILPDYKYSKNDIKKICKLILSTAIPQKPTNKLAEILCDADLDYLGSNEFFPIAENLRKELENNNFTFNDEEWLNFELDFLKKHKFFTNIQQKQREPKKQKIIQSLENQLKLKLSEK